MASTTAMESKEVWGEGEQDELAALTNEEIRQRTSMLGNNVRVLKSDLASVTNEEKVCQVVIAPPK